MLGILFASQRNNWGHGPTSSIQKIHEGPIPRIGGLAIVLGTWFSILCIHDSSTFFTNLVASLQQNPFASPLLSAQPPTSLGQRAASFVNPFILQTFMASTCTFIVGFLEDVTGTLPVRSRLLLTFIPGMALSLYTGIGLTHLGIPGVDTLLAYPTLAILFTGFALAGLAHAFNIVDGLNGLVSYMTLWILGAYLVLAVLYDDPLIAKTCLLLITPVLGFLFFNWPSAKCFLGDGGAYFLGFMAAWIGVALVARHSQLSAFAPALICAYPIAETLFSIGRRMHKKQSSGDPDREHLHQLFVFGVIEPYFAGRSQGAISSVSMQANSIAGLIISLLPIPCMVLTWFYSANQAVLVAGIIGTCLAYYSLYRYALRAYYRYHASQTL
ncbi:glycosyltransferase family 4 protein [Polynucleobacter sphagniphilus]|uniref:glycosyltransferase family 4 protein n=1 Tax=Polynucleobacter sphagniphilus TaxID=1743169 RepID=UPI0024763D64|nr:MraY family glycosyltransferase [Polynucleobacter sphagniphilus]MDH6525565.1 UDP-N-acetylmuramyl pentapeptide phosphotransferase/UDP-N-acetylglucosamine-1-phosphate transferase [Polynucleobacter sphagniphilus]